MSQSSRISRYSASQLKPRTATQKTRTRQHLSCTRCRERKVKCDRIDPCSACCASGAPNECRFAPNIRSKSGPILQFLELRKLRTENQLLKERLLEANVSLSDDISIELGLTFQENQRYGRQKRLEADESIEDLEFGTVVGDFALSDSQSVRAGLPPHVLMIPRTPAILAEDEPIYPFPCFWSATTTIQELLEKLDPCESFVKNIAILIDKAVWLRIPFSLEELAPHKIRGFFSDVERNSTICPDFLALLFAASALGMLFDDGGANNSQSNLRCSDVFVAASMQVLRISVFMSCPTLKCLQALLFQNLYLLNTGRLLDAWSVFGMSIRLAQSLDVQRSPEYLDPAPQTGECIRRCKIWWWMLHTDQLFSATLSRPLGISDIGDCPRAQPLVKTAIDLRLMEFSDQLTLLGRQILNTRSLTNPGIDVLTNKLISLYDTMPNILQFSHSLPTTEYELQEGPSRIAAAAHYCEIHSYIILLNRQRIEDTSVRPGSSSLAAGNIPVSLRERIYVEPLLDSTRSVSRGRPMVLLSSIALLSGFIYIADSVNFAIIDCVLSQQAFDACSILISNAVKTGDLCGIPKVEQAYNVFIRLQKSCSNRVASMAVSRLSEGLSHLRATVDSGREIEDRLRNDWI